MSLASLVAATPKGFLEVGDSGPAVKAAQLGLAAFGYALTGTGYFGTATREATKDYQRKAGGLAVDGDFGPATAKDMDGRLGAAAASAGVDGGPVVGTEPEKPLPSPALPLWVTAGLSLLNMREGSGGNDNAAILQWAKDEGGAIGKTYKHDAIPWCALFANHVLTVAGIVGTETLWALDFAAWGVPLAGPAVGAIAPMKRDGGGHVTIIVGRDTAGHLMGLGGNQADEVSIRPFPKSRPVGYRWPKNIPAPKLVGFDQLRIIASNGKISTKES